MNAMRRISIGGWIFLIHFSCVATVFLLPDIIPQPRQSITGGDHWYWTFLDVSGRLFFWMTLPASRFMSHPRDGGLYLANYPISEGTFIPFCVILALNSLLIGYAIQLLVSAARSLRKARHSPAL
jgi:hypothetical protein